MRRKTIISILLLSLITVTIQSQSLFDELSAGQESSSYRIKGFIRAGLFVNNFSNKASLSTGFSDLAIKLTSENKSSYKAYADIRFRYGMEFGQEVKKLEVNEAYLSWYTSWSEISVGQQITKWSNSDFFKTQDRMNPRDDLLRTFDDSDRDLGNIMAKLKLYPVNNISFEILYLPFDKPSALSTDIMDIPSLVKINKLPELRLSEDYGSLGINMGLHLKGADIGLSFYKGVNPMPMMVLDTLILEQMPDDPPTELSLNSKFYNISLLASNIEFALGKTVFRAEVSYVNTNKSGQFSQYIPFSELIWNTGIEPSLGNFRILLEYRGKKIMNFTDADAEPEFPESIILPPGLLPEQLEDAISLQLEAFNRLYNYQMKEYDHSLGLRLSLDNDISLISPELNILYGISSQELMLNPIINLKPADRLHITLGSDIYYGNKGSLYKLLENKLNTIYAGLRVDF